jgi:hypothetical protein
LLSVLIFTLLAAGAPGTPGGTEFVNHLKAFKGPQVALLFLAVIVVSVILQPFQIAIVQLLEGYWAGNPIDQHGRPSLAHKVAEIGIELQRRRYQFVRMLREDEDLDEQAEQRADAEQLLEEQRTWADSESRNYPELDSRLMPTRLGNILRAVEDRAGGRYGLDTNVVYPRLFSLLSDRLATGIANSNDQLDMAAHLCVALTVGTAVSIGLLLPNGWHNVLWLLVPAVTALLAWLSYYAAMRAAQLQGRLLETAFDLHRFDLLTALHFRLPNDPWSEYQFNRQLSSFLATAEASTREAELDGSVSDALLAVDYQHTADAAQDGSSRAAGPFQPFRWDWDAILADGESGNTKDQPDRGPNP